MNDDPIPKEIIDSLSREMYLVHLFLPKDYLAQLLRDCMLEKFNLIKELISNNIEVSDEDEDFVEYINNFISFILLDHHTGKHIKQNPLNF